MTVALYSAAVFLTAAYAVLSHCAAQLAASSSTVYAATLVGLWAAMQILERKPR